MGMVRVNFSFDLDEEHLSYLVPSAEVYAVIYTKAGTVEVVSDPQGEQITAMGTSAEIKATKVAPCGCEFSVLG